MVGMLIPASKNKSSHITVQTFMYETLVKTTHLLPKIQ